MSDVGTPSKHLYIFMKSLYWAKKGLFSKETVVLCRWGIEIQRFGFIIKQSGEIWIGQGRGIQKLTLGRSIFYLQ